MITSSDSDTPEDRAKSAQIRHLSVASVQQNWSLALPFTVAAPSFIIPAGAAENSRFLADYFPEICLLFFETEACLKYTDFDLPPDLVDLPVSWHVHLPLDLPWHEGMDVVWEKLSRLMKKVEYLSPKAWVLHPPTEPDMLIPLAARFRDAGIDPASILLENVEESDLGALWAEARTGGYSTCLDLGHILAYGQHSLLDLPGLWETVRMLHVYAPKNGGRHTGLGTLDDDGKALLRSMLDNFQGETITLEVFDETEIFDSLNRLMSWISYWNGKK
ncbi:MAG: hypothetical protein OCC46_03535 [Pseudodesulfovibrio sp.]